MRYFSVWKIKATARERTKCEGSADGNRSLKMKQIFLWLPGSSPWPWQRPPSPRYINEGEHGSRLQWNIQPMERLLVAWRVVSWGWYQYCTPWMLLSLTFGSASIYRIVCGRIAGLPIDGFVHLWIGVTENGNQLVAFPRNSSLNETWPSFLRLCSSFCASASFILHADCII